MRGQENVQFTSADAAAKELRGGRYAVAVQATFGGGSVKLQFALPDGTTFVSVGASTDFTAANTAIVIVELPPGQYKALITTATAVVMNVTRVPGE